MTSPVIPSAQVNAVPASSALSSTRLPALPILPGQTIGVMGGGQLGRMFAHAAQSMGFQVAVLEPDADAPAVQVANHHIASAYADRAGLDQLVGHAWAITTEFENVAADSLAYLAGHSIVAPAARAVAIAQHRTAEKAFFVECAAVAGIAPAPHHVIGSATDLGGADAGLFPGILKTTRMGYDGKGQISVDTVQELAAAWQHMQVADGPAVECILEKKLALAYEISVLVARGHDGQSVVYPIAQNVHRQGILFTTTVPAPDVSPAAAALAQQAALHYVQALHYVGVLCIEFFVLQDGTVVVNEMAPRPHNSGHYTIEACVTSQFAQQVRALTGLPLGSVSQYAPAIMLNILGDIWFSRDGQGAETRREPDWAGVLALPGVALHLYGKSGPRAGRKMGHITITAETLEQARTTLVALCALLGMAAPD